MSVTGISAKCDVSMLFESYGTVSFPPGAAKTSPEFCLAWAAACSLPQNKALVCLDRVEGGLCSADEVRQIRFRGGEPNDVNAHLSHGVWTIDEAADLCRAFVLVFDRMSGADVHRQHSDLAFWALETARTEGEKRIAEENYQAVHSVHLGSVRARIIIEPRS